uniref:UBP-type domain-containing protein n=1 Tax=Saimiri boliviensis boliviensis TaxID=39432 RepID=A0A2K6SG81_SAIBB
MIPPQPSRTPSVTSKPNIKKGAVPCSILRLAQVKKKGKIKKLSQAIEDLFVGLQGMDLNLETEALVGTGLVLDGQLNVFHCLWDDSFWESLEQLHAIKEQLIQEGLLDRCVSFQEELMLNILIDILYMNKGEFRVLPDTYDSVCFHLNLYSCACLASGSVIRLVDVVLGAEIWNGMHSLMDSYCIFSHVAVVALYAQQKHHIWRVFKVDWDVHHSQGTQFTFNQNLSVLYFFIHRYEQGRFWPHLKDSNWSTTGFGQGQGYTINMPWNQVGMRDTDYIAAFLHILLLVSLEFQPQLVLVAAGFDTLQGDPKGEMAATPARFTQLTHLLMGLAGGKLTLFFEGGYNLHILAEGISALLHTLLGDPCRILESSGACCWSAQASVSCALEALESFWEVLVRSTETMEGDNVEEDNVETWEPLLPILTWPVLQSHTGLVSDQSMMNHCNLWDSHHPKELGLAGCCLTLPWHPTTDAELFTCHSTEYVVYLQATEKMKTQELHRESSNFDSIYNCPSTFTCAQLAIGTVFCLVDSVLSGEVLNGATVVHTPGHHAEQDAACGFAISGHALQILIADWDVHHGNGTQHMFEDDPSVLYVSLHHYDRGTFFPMGDEGASSQLGRAADTGLTINVAWNGPLIRHADCLAAWHHLVLPTVYKPAGELPGWPHHPYPRGCHLRVHGCLHFLPPWRPLPVLTLPGPPLPGFLASITETIQVRHRYWPSLRVRKVEDKEGLSSSKLVTKKAPQPAKPRLKVLEAGMGKVISASSVEESTLGQTKSEPAVVALTQDQSVLRAMLAQTISKAAIGGAMLGQTTSEDAVGGAVLGQTTSEEAVGATVAQTTSEAANQRAALDQTTSEEALGGTELIQTPLTSPPSSPVQGSTPQISPSTLIGSLRTLELGSKSQGTPESQAPGEENLLGEAAGGQDMGSRGLTNQAIFYAVAPMPWCPHLVAICPIPAAGLDMTQPCVDYGTIQENWVCLSCHQIYCGFLSYIHLSTWCYYRQAYVHHQALLDVKNIAHQNNSEEGMSHPHQTPEYAPSSPSEVHGRPAVAHSSLYLG